MLGMGLAYGIPAAPSALPASNSTLHGLAADGRGRENRALRTVPRLRAHFCRASRNAL